MRPFPDPAMQIAGSFFCAAQQKTTKVTIHYPSCLRGGDVGA
jgi:hypothetical protein